MTLNENNAHIKKFSESILANLPYVPNEDQALLIIEFACFCNTNEQDAIFLLNGYAGTGKTSLTGALVKTLKEYQIKTFLLAPTGRSAKVFAEYSKHPAYTIHKKIYRQRSFSPEYGGFQLSENKHSNTIFIVDEASMIPNSASGNNEFGSGRLLDDLIEYVYGGVNCRLIILGDNAQLPPVGLTQSPALDSTQLRGYGLKVFNFTLTKSARQAQESGILHNASLLRESMSINPLEAPCLKLTNYTDIQNISGEYLIEKISDCYDGDGLSNTMILTRSNKRATAFNLAIRNQILYREEELVAGDMLLVAKNNYYWSEEYEEIDFIANGDIARVSRVRGYQKMYGFRFANVELEFPDLGVELSAMIILDALTTDTPALTVQQNESLFMQIMEELPGSKREKYKALKKNPFFNALQVKYAYTVTCHKAQGGQWKNIFIDMGYINEDALHSIDFYRWLYTSITRATHQVYLINSCLDSK